MFAVVVLDTLPRINLIVPEQFIYGLREFEDQLKTWGVSKKCHLVFWTRSLMDDNTASNTNIVPNFDLDRREDYPPPPEIESACYLARVKRFFSKFHCKFFSDCSKIRAIEFIFYRTFFVIRRNI